MQYAEYTEGQIVVECSYLLYSALVVIDAGQ